MADFFNSFIDTLFGLLQFEWFSLPFITLIALWAWCFISIVIWGRE